VCLLSTSSVPCATDLLVLYSLGVQVQVPLFKQSQDGGGF